jgi:hypothetical protein
MGFLNRFATPVYRKIYKIALLVITCAASFFALILPIAQRTSTYTLSPGDVAGQDIQAPNSLSFISQILTEQARLDAEHSASFRYINLRIRLSLAAKSNGCALL